MHGVEALGLVLGQVLQPERDEAESGFFDAVQDPAGVAGLHGIGLDDGECALHKRWNYMQSVLGCVAGLTSRLAATCDAGQVPG